MRILFFHTLGRGIWKKTRLISFCCGDYCLSLCSVQITKRVSKEVIIISKSNEYVYVGPK